ncbi:MAG: hypothetical protein F6K54_05330 [Okeania sp. SIO3B5]|uniref:hypothetical protein n=1 Tax=Okeania sp. SIO3B5 TaxID=2607811 RepID=UPI0013FEE6CC|nr:hypothetical protein [Okeania sp. SIO3B5]NEO52541.1 hypothetical protein [Okeania sp. SIO3B5]
MFEQKIVLLIVLSVGIIASIFIILGKQMGSIKVLVIGIILMVLDIIYLLAFAYEIVKNFLNTLQSSSKRNHNTFPL